MSADAGLTSPAVEPAAAVDGLAPPRARCDPAFIARLAHHSGARLVHRDDVEGLATAPAAALDETVPRTDPYLDVLGTP